MRSMHVIGSRQSGGAERFYLRLVSALARRGEEVLSVMQPNSALRELLDPSISQRHVKMRSVFDPFARARIGAAARTFEADVVQSYMGRATRLTHLPRGKGRAVHVARLGGYYDVKGYRHAHAWVANAHGIRDHLVAEGLPEDRVFYIGNFVGPPCKVTLEALKRLRAELQVAADGWLLVCLGRLHRNKAFDVMLEAFARVRPSILGRVPYLVVVGDGPEAGALHQQAERLGIAPRVRFTGWRSAPEPYLHLADVFVCPSRHEPLGNVVLEAWNEGAPVLASDTGGLAELIDDGVNGRLIEPEDADALAAGIEALLGADPTVREALRREGTARLQAYHSERVVVDAYLELYHRLTRAR